MGRRERDKVLIDDDRFLGDVARHRAALRAVLEAEPMDVPDPAPLREELEAIRDRHA